MKTQVDSRCFRQQGFTLLEFLVSMALAALLLGMLSAGVGVVVDDWQDEAGGLEESVDQVLVLMQIERALQGAFPHTHVHPQRLARQVYFVGNSDELRFVSTVSPQRGPGLMAWRLKSDPGRGLQLHLAAAHGDNPDARLIDAKPILLLPGYQARFRFLVQRNPDEQRWLEEWRGEEMQSLPLAVEIVLTPDTSSGRKPVLEILAPIRAHRHENIEPTIPVI
jgi:general secretion pathway protein J